MECASRHASRVGWATRAAMTWCVVFALLHLFWAFGGSTGLASSAGGDIAYRRPTTFVVFGLYGVAAVLLVGAVLLRIAVEMQPGKRRAATLILLFGVGVALALRGIGLEAVLATNIGGVRELVGPLETRWSQILWNPWFALA